MKHIAVDLETFSSINLAKSGVYKYCEADDFEILLFGYSVDGGEVKVIDFASGEEIPTDIINALSDEAVIKHAFNAQFERTCLSKYLGIYLPPESWQCTMVWAATLGLPLSLEGVGAVLGLEKQKLKEGKDLIRYFCTPYKNKDGSYTRHYPTDAPDRWERFKKYNIRDVETELEIQKKLSKFPVSESEWINYHLDQRINDRGILLDIPFVKQAMRCDNEFKQTHIDKAIELGFADGILEDEKKQISDVTFDEPRSNGDSNAKIANILEYGKSGQPPKPFLKPAKSQSKKSCIEAMKNKLESEIESL